MNHTIYNIAMTAIAPFAALWMALSARRRPMLARFRPSAPEEGREGVWMHACSVGEVGVARPYLASLRARYPELPLLLTVSTPTGHEAALKQAAGWEVAWCPMDTGFSVRGFLRKVRPCILILTETEIWPTLIGTTRSAGIPVVIANARLSDKHIRGYQKYGWLFRRSFEALSLVCAQNAEYAARFTAMGVSPDKARVLGSAKFDCVALNVDQETVKAIREQCGIPPDSLVLVFGSLREGEERVIGACWKVLRDLFPNLRLIAAPRHLNRLSELLAQFDEPVRVRSSAAKGDFDTYDPARVLIVNTMGELSLFYSLADVAVVGGSFNPDVNGHNPLEPAALGTPTVFGPFMRNFSDAAAILVVMRGAVQVDRGDALLVTLRRLLQDPEERDRLGATGRAVVMANKGCVERTLDILAPLAGLDQEES